MNNVSPAPASRFVETFKGWRITLRLSGTPQAYYVATHDEKRPVYTGIKLNALKRRLS